MKSKIVKRVLAASLATVMTAGLVGCNNGGGEASSAAPSSEASKESSEVVESTEESTEESSEEVGTYPIRTDKDGNTVDLGGIEVIIRDWWSGDGERKEAADDYEEARYEYLDWAQETYNFTIKEMTISDWASTPEDFNNYVTTQGDDNYYVFTLRQGAELIGAMNSGLMYDVSTLDVFDFSEPKWVSGVHQQFSKGNAIYGFRGIEPEPRGGLFFNKRILEEAGIDPNSLYDLQEAGEWTWDKFEEICAQVQRDTDNDGVDDVYALASFNSEWYPEAVYSNGGDFITKDASGKYVSALESDATIEALNWAVDMWDKYDESKAYPEDASWDYWLTAFRNGEAAFMAREAYAAGTNLNTADDPMEDEFGFLCFPKGPKAKDYCNVYSDNVYAIPSCYDADKAWKIAFAYDIYTEPIPGFENYSGYKQGQYQNFVDLESVDLTYERLLHNGRTTYHTMVAGIDLGPDLFWAINKDNTPAAQAEAIRGQWEGFLADANK